MNLKVSILEQDTLRAMGLKYILQEYFGLTPEIFTDIDTTNIDRYDLIISNPDIFSKNLDYLLPKRAKILLIFTNSNNPNSINYNAPLNDIIESLKIKLQDIKDNNITTKNELSEREIEVLKLIAKGYLNKEIADQLNISINTVLSHRKNITFKLGIKSVSGLSLYAMMHGYISNI